MGFFKGKPEKFEQKSLLGPEQQGLYKQLLNSGMGYGGGGAFGQSSDYYRNLLSDNPQDLESMAAPDMRRFQQQIMPDIASQFAGQGSGALSSSSFRNALSSAGTDLSERIAAIRAGLRSRAAEGLTGIGRMGLGTFNENILRPRTPSFMDNILPLLAKIAAAYFGGGGGMGSLSSLFSGKSDSTSLDSTSSDSTS